MLKFPDIFQDGMILQREKKVLIKGSSDHTQQIEICADGRVLLRQSIEEGNFLLWLPPQPAMESVQLLFREEDGSETVFRDVDFGEVWIAGGQSNMEMPMRYTEGYEEIKAAADDSHFRCYTVAQWCFEGEEEDGFKDASRWNRWLPWKPDTMDSFTAVGSYFALQLRKALQVPIGIVSCSYGGTTASAWMEEKLLREHPSLRIYCEEYEQGLQGMDMEQYLLMDRTARMEKADPKMTELMEMLRKMVFTEEIGLKLRKAAVDSAEIRGALPVGPHSENRPGGLYESMLKKITGYTCKGVIWYQGETDDKKADLYQELFTEMIACWRRDWEEELPFLYVQLAPFGFWMSGDGTLYPKVREAQDLVSKTVPNVWMTSVMDVGEQYDIHPKKKRPVGERLALLARGKVYGEDILCENPEPADILRQEGRLLCFFKHAEGLHIQGGALQALEVKAGGNVLENWSAQVDNNCLIITSSDIHPEEEAELFFAEKGYCEVNLYNAAGLPAKPFHVCLKKLWEESNNGSRI